MWYQISKIDLARSGSRRRWLVAQALLATSTMALTAEVRRERRRAKAAPFPRPRGRSPPSCTWDEQQGGWWRADGSHGLRKTTGPLIGGGSTSLRGHPKLGRRACSGAGCRALSLCWPPATAWPDGILLSSVLDAARSSRSTPGAPLALTTCPLRAPATPLDPPTEPTPTPTPTRRLRFRSPRAGTRRPRRARGG